MDFKALTAGLKTYGDPFYVNHENRDKAASSNLLQGSSGFRLLTKAGTN
jgi:hypothetical protein